MRKQTYSYKNRTFRLVATALMVALVFVFSRFLGINSDVIHLGLDFLPVFVIACLYGPAWAAVTYILGDLISAIIMPLGMINPGITAIAGIIGLVYGLAFYNREYSRKAFIVTTLWVSLLVSGVIKLFGTTLCLSIAYGSPYFATVISRIPTCALLFITQIITIPIAYRFVVIPVRKHFLKSIL